MFFSKLPALVDFYHDGRAECVIHILVPLCFVHCLLSPGADGPACIAAFDMSHLLLLLDVELKLFVLRTPWLYLLLIQSYSFEHKLSGMWGVDSG